MDEECEMKHILESFDSSFKIIENITNMSRNQIRCILDKVKKEIDTEKFVVDIELPRIWNTAAFLHVILNEYDEALIYARKSSDQCAQNINSKIIQTYCHLQRAKFFESRQMCNKLEELRGNKMEVLLAKAEMAFTYSRLGLEMFELAEQAFTEVCQQCKESPGVEVPIRYICLWKFGLALTMKRTLNFHNLHEYNKSMYTSNTTDRFKTVFRLFNDVAGTDDFVAKYVARACVELGLLVNTIEKSNVHDVDFSEATRRKSKYYFVKAFKLCPDDLFVLERSGKYYRYNNDIEMSVDLLSKAVSIRSTSFGHHHLALSLKRQLEIGQAKTHPNSRAHMSTGAQHHHVRQSFGTESRANFRGRNKHIKNIRRPTSQTERRPSRNYNTSYRRGSHTQDYVPLYTPDFEMENSVPSRSRTKANESNDHLHDATADSIDQAIDDMSHMHLHDSTTRRRMRNENAGDGFSYSGLLTRNQRTFGRYQRTNGRSAHQSVANECLTRGTDNTKSSSGCHDVYSKDKLEHKADTHRLDSQRSRRVQSIIKSPKKIKYLEPNQSTEKILFHLDEAYKLNYNVGSLYDKGLFLRQIKEGDTALDTFIRIVSREKPSLLQLANAYEQAAFCLSDGETQDGDPAGAERRQYNIKMYLKKSIEIRFTMVANIPLLCEAWESLPTLKNILCGQAKTKGTLKELAFVHEKMKDYKDAIGCYNDIIKLEESEEKKTEVYFKIVENYQRIGDHDEAVLCLDMIMCLPDAIHKIHPGKAGLYLTTYIGGGMDAVKNRETNIAGVRLRKALDYRKSLAKTTKNETAAPHESETDIDNEGYFDLYIHCDESVEDKWRPIKDLLIGVGLRVTLNSDDNIPGSVEFLGMLGNLEKSTHCIIIAECNEETLTPYAQMFIGHVVRNQKMKKYSNIVVVQDDEKEMTSNLTMFQSVVFRPDQEYNDTSELSQDTLDQLNDLMFKLATPSE